jgi:L-2-hydroxyglutarate oxidase LhgO
MYEAECIVVGAGVVGLAIARELALAGREVIVLEAEVHKGAHASSRNTSVIHAGINYAPGSYKGRFCRDGKQRLYRYCAERNIPHQRIGKLVISDKASGEEGVNYLRKLQAKAHQQGLAELHLMTESDVRQIEPQLVCGGALFSPSSGIIDVHAYMDALQGDLEDHRGAIAFSSPVRSGKIEGGKIQLTIGDEHATQISCRILVNAAGLNAPHVASSIQNRSNHTIPPRLLAKGSYCVLKRRSPFSHLVYPAPHGVHASLDLGGQLRFGPDSEWIDEIDYQFDERRIAPFYQKIRAFWPDLRDGDLAPGWVGIRAKISTGNTNETDFRIDVSEAGPCCLIDLYGIDSPGLTASMAIAAEVNDLVLQNSH